MPALVAGKFLRGMRVLDLSRLLPGPFCSMVLADHGAEVLKIEAPGSGDYIRSWPPQVAGESALFLAVNRNKKSLTLNLKEARGREIFLRLAATYDVVLESFRPGVMERLGIDFARIRKINPRIIYCSITGYGQFGPEVDKPGHDLNYLAAAGILHLGGGTDGRPTIPGVQIADLAGGALYAVNGILLAYIGVLQGGEGVHVDISMTDGLVSLLSLLSAYHFAAGTDPGPNGTMFNGGLACYQVYRTADGQYMALGALEEKFWRNFCQAVGRPDLVDRQHDDAAGQQKLYEEVEKIFAARTRRQWEELLAGRDTCCEAVKSLAEVTADPHFQARKMFFDLHFPGGGTIRQLNSAIMVNGEKTTSHRFPPALGEHTEEVLAGLGYSAPAIAALRREGVV